MQQQRLPVEPIVRLHGYWLDNGAANSTFACYIVYDGAEIKLVAYPLPKEIQSCCLALKADSSCSTNLLPVCLAYCSGVQFSTLSLAPKIAPLYNRLLVIFWHTESPGPCAAMRCIAVPPPLSTALTPDTLCSGCSTV